MIMHKKMRALIMGATALATSFMLGGTATAAGGPDCWTYAHYSYSYCDTLSGMDAASCITQTFQSEQQCMMYLHSATMTAAEKQRAAARLAWPGR
ncbi:hypothetical protein [Streptomyces sp. NPDC054958]